jgi:hypothetical protein
MPAKTMLPKKEAKLIEVINGIFVANEYRLFAAGEGQIEGDGEGKGIPHAIKCLMTRV